MRGAKFLHKHKVFCSIGKDRKCCLKLGIAGVAYYFKIYQQLAAGHRLGANIGDIYTGNRKGRDVAGKRTGKVGKDCSDRSTAYIGGNRDVLGSALVFIELIEVHEYAVKELYTASAKITTCQLSNSVEYLMLTVGSKNGNIVV